MMDNLRLILIIAGIIILAGIYLWDNAQRKRKLKRQRINSAIDVKHEPQLIIPGKSASDDDLAAELADLNSFMSGSNEDAEDDAEPEAIIIKRDSAVQTGKGWGRDAGAEIPDLFSQSATEEDEPAVAPDKRATVEINPDSVITLYIVAAKGAVLGGSDIYAALSSLGFKFGEMNIFHHYGIGQLKSDRPLFSLVNILEPGFFDLSSIDDLTTRGLSVFMCLPTSQSSEVIFSYMLEITGRLANKLDAIVLGPDRKEISQRTLDSITIQIKKYDQT